MEDYYVPKRLTPNTKSVKVDSGFGLSQNEANFVKSCNDINVCDNLSKAWTEPKQGMSKFPMNVDRMFEDYRHVNEPQIGGDNRYPSDTNISARDNNNKGGQGIPKGTIKNI